MELKLIKEPNEIIALFKELKRPQDVADLLEIPYKVLLYYLYIINDSKKYQTFFIPKKRGGVRNISAPIAGLKIIQQKLNCILHLIYHPKPSAYGFIKGKNIVGNSERHCQKRFVFNADIENYFPSINFGRVRGVFLSPPYELNPSVSTVLAQICCWNNQLPQGAPTSPIISNMVCSRLDTQLQKLAHSLSCDYSRYADDITFSTTRKSFPKEIAFQLDNNNPQAIQIGDNFQEIIKSNGFLINKSKVRLQTKYNRQEVTGLIVNKFPNVKRKFMNQVRAMLHAWEKYGATAAGIEYIKNYRHKHKASFMPCFNESIKPDEYYKNVVKGKINYLKMVRGTTDQSYQTCITKLAVVDPTFKSIYERMRTPTYHDLVIVIECSKIQGTAFFMKNIGIITCAHTVTPDSCVHKGLTPEERNHVDIVWKDDRIDIAVLKYANMPSYGFKFCDSKDLRVGEDVVLLGFPNYGENENYQRYPGKIVGSKKAFGVDVYITNAFIISGNSGGPVLNNKGEVIGIAQRGAADFDDTQKNLNCFIPIFHLLDKYRPEIQL